MLALAVWSLAYILRLGSSDVPSKLLWAKVRYLGIVVVPTAWLVFVLQYTGREEWLQSHNIALLAIEPLVVLLLAWTNDAHHLIWREIKLVSSGSLVVWDASHGTGFWAHVVYTYLLLLLSTLLLIQMFFRAPRPYRGQAGVLLASSLIPLAGDVLSTCNLVPFMLDLTPFAFTITGLMIAWGISRFRLFDVVPVAHSAVVENMGGGVFVLDMKGRVIDANPAAQDIVGLSASEIVGRPFAHVLPDISDLIGRRRDVAEMHAETKLGEGENQRSYDLHISPFRDQRGHLRGRLVVLHDITERKQAESNLIAQKQLFESLVAMARATAKHTSLEATLQSAMNMAATLTGAEHGSMFLLDGTGVVTHSVLARGETTLVKKQSLVGSVMESGLAGWVVRQRRPALVEDTSRDERWLPLPDAPYTARSALSIPLVSGSAVLGVLTLTHSELAHFTTQHAFLLQSAADQTMMAVRNAQMYDDQRRLAGLQTMLYEVLRTAGEYLDPEAIAHSAVETIARLTGWRAVAILLPDEKETHLVVRAGAGALSMAEGVRVSVDQSITGRAFRTAQTQHVPDVSADPDHVSSDSALRSELAVPLRRGERVLGVLDVASDRQAAFNADNVLLAKSLAEAIALTLDNARLYAEIRRYAADLSTLYTVARAISRSLVLKNILAETLSSALASLDFEAGLISLFNQADGRLYLATEQGIPPAMASRLRQEGMDGTLCAYVHERGKVAAVGDIEQGTRTVSKLEQQVPQAISEMRTLGMRAYSGIPLLHQERSMGTLSLFARQPRTLSAEDQALQMAIGRQIATAVTNARLFQGIADERSRLQALIESSRDGIILIGMEQHMLVVNAPAVEMLRLSGRPENWIGRPMGDVLTTLKQQAPAAVKAFQGEMHRIRTGDEVAGEGECDIPPRAIHWMNLPVREGAAPLGRLLVLRDVTEERLLERMRDDLTHAMVHDLRNPLTVISGALTLLDKDIADDLSSNQHQLWEIACDSLENMLKLVTAILDISRLESRQMPLEHTLISLDDLVTEVLDTQLPLAADKGLRLESEVPSDLPPAWADRGLIARVLQNLIGNAIKFTPTGGVVRVTARPDDSERPRPLVSVIDTGPGVQPEVQERLFQKFVTGRHAGRGSGLGLTFCKMVMDAHDERIWLESTSSEGTTFTFSLPLPPALES
jgi:PAS domain S-box-containing protein